MPLKRTDLYPLHQELKAKMTPFGGWEMPLFYTGIISEHLTTRRSAGLFDVSHMGEIELKGKGAFNLLQYLTTNNLERLKRGKAQYTLFCDQSGGIIDDLLVYNLGEEDYLLCVNSSNTEKDYLWILKNNPRTGIKIRNVSEQTGQLALQGKNAEKILQKISPVNLSVLKSFSCLNIELEGIKTLISRTGYTGEEGFELYFPSPHASSLWKRLMDAGREFALQPIGLGARDSLRLEMGYLLYGNELSENITPLEANLDKIVKFEKGDFMSRPALLKQREEGLKKMLIGVEMEGRYPLRSHCPIWKGKEKIGEITSGTFSPCLKKFIGLGFIAFDSLPEDQKVEIENRAKRRKAKIVSPPFYKKNK